MSGLTALRGIDKNTFPLKRSDPQAVRSSSEAVFFTNDK